MGRRRGGTPNFTETEHLKQEFDHIIQYFKNVLTGLYHVWIQVVWCVGCFVDNRGATATYPHPDATRLRTTGAWHIAPVLMARSIASFIGCTIQ